ncbi:MAG: hypothetical protein RBT76_12385 [candidate division Zixibacteria bacterium]|nr:hypothetical protein [candidate division Zixibacteria bacterium]
MSDSQHTHGVDPTGTGYEKSDVSVPWITTIALIVIGVIVVFIVILNEYFLVTKERLVYDTVLSTPSAALRELRAREDEELHSYKVLDSAAGAYQIPIDRAMELQAGEAHERRLKDR